MLKVNFLTPTRISLIDITSMGDSSKRGDATTIGQFDSGLKYAIAILLRHDVKLSIHVQGETIIHDHWEEPTTEVYNFSTFTEGCENTGKEKELIQVDCLNIPHGGACMNQYDMREPGMPESWTVKTGFAKALGYNWELWMALRELWSNMLDEGGHIGTYYEEEIEGTVMILEFEPDSEFGEVWNNRHLYINEMEPLFKISDSVEALPNQEGYIRIYKQNILVYKDEAIPSLFAYNIKYGEIDERRVLSNVYSVKDSICDAIKYCKNEEFLRSIITPDLQIDEKDFINTYTSIYGTASDVIHNIAVEVFEANEEKVFSFAWLMHTIRKRKDCGIDGKTIRSIGDHVYGYSNDVKIESKPIAEEPAMENEEKKFSFAEQVSQMYRFELDVPVKTAKLRGSKVIADKHEKCLIVDESFSLEEDMAALLVQYMDLTKTGNIITNLSEYLVTFLKIK